jgi:threonine dehydrogenase-like Zn-dependent dehydrogenase
MANWSFDADSRSFNMVRALSVFLSVSSLAWCENSLTRQERKEGFESFFNGKTLERWHSIKQSKDAGAWQVRKHTMTWEKGGSWLATDDTYYERGINLRHGYLTEHYVDDVEFIVKVPKRLKHVGVLLEPTTVVEKGIHQAYEIQRRLKVWRPRKAAVMGAGTIGLLATLVLRLKGLDVTTFGRTDKPYLNSNLIEELGARYLSTKDVAITDAAKEYGPFDLIFEGTGNSAIVFDSMQALGKNGVLVLASVTGGDKVIQIPADRINLEFVLGNKVMVGTVNANREYFERGVGDMAQAEAEYPGWLSKLLTDPVKGLENYGELFQKLTSPNGAIKVYCEVA